MPPVELCSLLVALHVAKDIWTRCQEYYSKTFGLIYML